MSDVKLTPIQYLSCLDARMQYLTKRIPVKEDLGLDPTQDIEERESLVWALDNLSTGEHAVSDRMMGQTQSSLREDPRTERLRDEETETQTVLC